MVGTEDNVCWSNPLNAELNPICHLLALLGAHLIHHVSRIRVKHNHKKFEANLFGKRPQKYLILCCHYKSNNMAHEGKFKQLDKEAKKIF